MDTSQLNNFLDEIGSDKSVPRNIRTKIAEAKQCLNNMDFESSIRISNAIATLDEIGTDSNIPTYTRTQIWNIVSMLEILKRENNGNGN